MICGSSSIPSNPSLVQRPKLPDELPFRPRLRSAPPSTSHLSPKESYHTLDLFNIKDPDLLPTSPYTKDRHLELSPTMSEESGTVVGSSVNESPVGENKPSQRENLIYPGFKTWEQYYEEKKQASLRLAQVVAIELLEAQNRDLLQRHPMDYLWERTCRLGARQAFECDARDLSRLQDMQMGVPASGTEDEFGGVPDWVPAGQSPFALRAVPTADLPFIMRALEGNVVEGDLLSFIGLGL